VTPTPAAEKSSRRLWLSLGAGAIAGWIGAALYVAIIATPFALALIPGMGLYVTLGIPFGAICGLAGSVLIPVLRGKGRWPSSLLYGLAWGLLGVVEWWVFSTAGKDFTNNEGSLLTVLANAVEIGGYLCATGFVVGAFLIFRPLRSP